MCFVTLVDRLILASLDRALVIRVYASTRRLVLSTHHRGKRRPSQIASFAAEHEAIYSASNLTAQSPSASWSTSSLGRHQSWRHYRSSTSVYPGSYPSRSQYTQQGRYVIETKRNTVIACARHVARHTLDSGSNAEAAAAQRTERAETRQSQCRGEILS